MSGLIYSPEGHIYRINGEQIPGITRVLADTGFNGQGSKYFTSRSSGLGKAVHTASRLSDARNMTDIREAKGIFEGGLHPDLVPYLEGWLLFKKETGFVSGIWEQPICSERLRIAGTPDVCGEAKGIPTIVDLKTGTASGGFAPKRSHELQIAGYAIMKTEGKTSWERSAALGIQRWVVWLPGNGSYRLFQCTNRDDFPTVNACCIVWHALASAGAIKLTGDPEEGAA